MRLGKCPAAEVSPIRQNPKGYSDLGIESGLHVSQLTDVVVEVPSSAVAKEDIAGGLNRSLPDYDALAITSVLTPTEITLKNGRLCLLQLQNKRVRSDAPIRRSTKQRVPTLPMPTTFLAKSANVYR